MEQGDVLEIDDVEELAETDKSYEKYVRQGENDGKN